jgi:hypothetical protein
VSDWRFPRLNAAASGDFAKEMPFGVFQAQRTQGIMTSRFWNPDKEGVWENEKT